MIVAAVAVLYVALAVANGGYSSELTAGATVGIWWAVVIGLAMGAWPRSRVPGAAVGAGASLVALAAWTAISIGWASDAGGAFVEVVRALGYLGLFLLVVIASPRASARMWLSGLALGLVVVAGLALASRFEPSFVGNQNLGTFLPAAAGRLSYPIGYWNGLAAAMAAGILLLVWLGGHARAAWLRAVSVAVIPLPVLVIYFASSRGGVLAGVAGLAVLLALGPGRARMLAGAVMGGVGGVLLASLASRKLELVDALTNSVAASQGDQMLALTIAVAAGVGLLRFLADDWLEELDVPARLTRVVAVGTVIAVVAGILAANPAARWSEFKQVGALDVQTTYNAAHLSSGRGSGRYQFWSAALDAFEAHPLDGIGAGGYEAYWDQHGTLVMPVRNAHSLFFETMAELGIVGLLLILGFLGFAAVAGARRAPTRSAGAVLGATLAVFTAGVVSAAIDWTWELPACFGLVVLAAGVLSGPALEREAAFGAEVHAVNGWRARGLAPRPRFGLGVVTLLLGGASIWAGGTLFLTEVRLGNSRQEASAGNLKAAAQAAHDAITIEPWAAGPRLQLALVEELGGNLRAANREISEAIDRAPDNWQLWFVRTRLDVKSGNVDGARRALERARELNPRAPFLSQ
ncbi:MAG: O-antigen ligase family protein [Solirubrobacterales bacterium]